MCIWQDRVFLCNKGWPGTPASASRVLGLQAHGPLGLPFLIDFISMSDERNVPETWEMDVY